MKEFDCFENINVFLFDLNQYNYNVKELYVSVFVNYYGKIYVSNEVYIYPTAFCDWVNNKKWVLRDDVNLEVLKIKGCLEIKKEVFHL